MIALSDDRPRSGSERVVRDLVRATEAPIPFLVPPHTSAIPERVDDFSGWDWPARRRVLTRP
jgi:hypothetical protein